MKKYILALLLSFLFLSAQAATKTWVGTTNAWATGTNWSPSGIPGSGDNVIFSNNKPCTISANYTVNSLNLNGYTSTITISSTRSLTILTSFAVNSGTILKNGTGGIILNTSSNTSISGGTLTLASNSVNTFDNITISGGNISASANMTFNNDVRMTGGTLTGTNGGFFTINSSIFKTSGTFNTPSVDAYIYGLNSTISGGFGFKDIIFSSAIAAANVNTYVIGSLTANGVLYFDPNDFVINLYRDPIYVLGDFDPFSTAFQTTGTVIGNNLFIFNGTVAQNVGLVSDVANGYFFSVGSLQFNNTTAGVTLTSLVDNTNIVGGMTILGGSLHDGGFDITLPTNQNFLVSSGSAFDCAATSLPAVSGSGQFILSGLTSVSLTGANAQTLPYSLLYNNLTVNKTAGDVTISSGTTSVSGFLTIAALGSGNKFNTGGNLVLTSNTTSTGSLIDFSTSGGGGSVNGNMTVQRAYNGATNKTRVFGTPIASATVYDLGQGTYNVLLFTESGQSPDPARVAGYNNSFTSSFRNATLVGNNLSVGRGYSIVKSSSGVLNFTGVPNNGPIVVPVTYTTGTLLGISPSSSQGSNLLSNPYPSAVDWTQVNLGSTGISGSGVSIWNGSTYVATSVIPSCQGFFIQASASGNITFTGAARIGSGTGNNTIYRTTQKSKWFYLNVTAATGGAYDALAVSFNDFATAGFDPQYDLRKIYVASGPLMYSSVGADKMSLSIVPYPQQQTVIPVTLRVPASGNFKFTTSSFADWYDNYDVFLKDSTGAGVQLIDLRTVTSYSFSKNSTDADTASRFSLVFRYDSVATVTTGTGDNTGANNGNRGFNGTGGSNTVIGSFLAIPDQELRADGPLAVAAETDVKESKVYANGKNIYVNFSEGISSKSDLVVYDFMGNVVYESKGLPSSGSLVIPLLHTEKSVYIVKLVNEKELIVKKVLLY